VTQARRRDAAVTRTELLNAARDRFAEQGYESTTLRQVASDVGVNPALVNRYFGNKEALFGEVVGPRADFVEVADVPVEQLGAELVRRALVQLRSAHSGSGLLALLHSQSSELGLSRLREIIVSELAHNLADPTERTGPQGPCGAHRGPTAWAEHGHRAVLRTGRHPDAHRGRGGHLRAWGAGTRE